ncbi:MAG: hypothetical protein II981_06500 [Bacteroidales bacterium]|nr:hypothetical protein [Bacteroidales bacterium]
MKAFRKNKEEKLVREINVISGDCQISELIDSQFTLDNNNITQIVIFDKNVDKEIYDKVACPFKINVSDDLKEFILLYYNESSLLKIIHVITNNIESQIEDDLRSNNGILRFTK